MKDKLIELLRRSIAPEMMVQPIAEFLEENGVVLPVRCKECVHGEDNGFICRIGRGSCMGGGGTFSTSYCDDGERREDNGA